VSGVAEDRLSVEHWVPDPRLAAYVSAYRRIRIPRQAAARHEDVLLPGWACLRFAIDGESWQVRLGRRLFAPVPPAALFGPGSRAGYVEAGGGTLVGAEVTPRGWARLFSTDASAVADRIVPLGSLFGAEAGVLHERLQGGAPIKQTFDDWFEAGLARTSPEPAAVAALFDLLEAPQLVTVAEVAERLGLSYRALGRLSRTAFGFPPKLLLRRARFLRALAEALTLERGRWSEASFAAGYYDRSHFVRDCRRFLDRPLGIFAALPKPLAELGLELRRQAQGQGDQGPYRTDPGEAELGRL
jgi:AraC-like DNA-binding protein